MEKTNPILLMDFYKAVHKCMLPKNLVKSVSYFTPRMSRIKEWDKVVNFGLQAFCKTYLIDYFNEYFFNRSEEDVMTEYNRVMDNTLGVGISGAEMIRNLHRLHYLPIEIVSLKEGTLVPMHVPMFGITNTHKDFAWVGQALESLISAELWYGMVTATVGHTYRQIVNHFYDLTVDDNVPRRKALGNFDFRGDKGLEASLKAGGGWCLSFVNTATVPVIPYLEKNYNCDCTKEEVGFGSPSTEHFVMCTNSAYDTLKNPKYEYEDIDPRRERVFLKRLLTEIYPNTSFSCVCDSYDYWNVVNNILPTLREEIMQHNGCFLVRGDSGDCVEVVTNTVFKLWDIFGGTINSKGYKVLDKHVKAIYGDSITTERAKKIYTILMEHGFACSNVALGVGSFSMQCLEVNGTLNPFTRDTFSMAIKAVYAEFEETDGTMTKMPIFKDPLTDKGVSGGNFKKSQKGCCRVFFDENNELKYQDELTWDESLTNNLLVPIFKDGKFIKETTLSEVREILNDNNF